MLGGLSDHVQTFVQLWHEGFGLSFWFQAYAKAVILLVLMLVMILTPDSPGLRGMAVVPLRSARVFVCLACAGWIADVAPDGWAAHLTVSVLFMSFLCLVLAQRHAAWQSSRRTLRIIASIEGKHDQS